MNITCLLLLSFVFVSAKNAPEGVILFKSGFEGEVRVVKTGNADIDERIITGTDHSTPKGINNWDLLVKGFYLSWVKKANAFLQGGDMEIAKDPTGIDNKVLHFHNTRFNTKPAGKEGRRSRTQWLLNQVEGWEDDGNPNRFDKQFYRYRMYIPCDIKKAVAFEEDAPWYGIWESHSWEHERTRHSIRLHKKANSNWCFQVVQEHPEGTSTWENDGNQDVEVPFDAWFTLEVFFKYHETEGEFFVAITREGHPRQSVAHFTGKTKYGTKLRDQMVFKMYHDAAWFDKVPGGTHQYYDDFEIWSDFPSGYF